MFYAMRPVTDSNGITVDSTVRKNGYKNLETAINHARKYDGHVKDGKNRIVWFQNQLFDPLASL